MKMKTLQSLASRNRNYISALEAGYTDYKQTARELKAEGNEEIASDYYKACSALRKEIAKMAAIQKDIKAEIKDTVEFERSEGDFDLGFFLLN